MNLEALVNKIKILLTLEEAKWPLSRVFPDFRPLEPMAAPGPAPFLLLHDLITCD